MKTKLCLILAGLHFIFFAFTPFGVAESWTLTLTFAGDTSLARGISQITKISGAAYPLGNSGEILKTSDLALLNLECSVARSGKLWMDPPNEVYLRADPLTMEVLREAGVDFVSLANNHVLDFGYEALFETMDHLAQAEIKWAGAGKTIFEAKKPALITASGVTVAVFSSTDNAPHYSAQNNRAGTWFTEIPPAAEFYKEIDGEIERLRRENVPLIIFSVHWGPNMVESPSSAVQEFAHRLIDHGIDIIHGHSSHVFQGIEIYKGKVIMYSTGDFLNDFLPLAGTEEQFLYSIVSAGNTEMPGNEIKEVRLIPIKIENLQANLADDKTAKRMMETMRRRSAIFRTEIVWENGNGYIRPPALSR